MEQIYDLTGCYTKKALLKRIEELLKAETELARLKGKVEADKATIIAILETNGEAPLKYVKPFLRGMINETQQTQVQTTNRGTEAKQ